MCTFWFTHTTRNAEGLTRAHKALARARLSSQGLTNRHKELTVCDVMTQ